MSQNMNSVSWVRIAFVLIGVLALVMAIKTVDPAVKMLTIGLLEERDSDGELLWVIVATLVAPVVLCICAYIFVRYCHYFAARVAHLSKDRITYWEEAAYRLAFTVAGILLLAFSLPSLGQVVHNLMARNFSEEYRLHLVASAWAMTIRLSVQTAFGIYLLYGAPHIVKWQTTRIANQDSSEKSDP